MRKERPSTCMPTPPSLATYMARELMALLALVAVAIYDVFSSPPEPAIRLPLILLHALFFIGFVSIDLINLRLPISGHMALVILVTIQLLLIWFGSDVTTQIVMLFVLSAYAHEALPATPANLWILGFGIATMIGFSLLINDIFLGSLIGLGVLGGYSFIGHAARNRRVAEDARAESQRLLHELQVAHEQLKRHAHEAEVLAAAEERNHLARELHDTLGHRLTVAAVQLEGAQRLISRDAAKAEQMVGVVRGQVLDALTELRQTVAALRTPLEADLSLPAAIQRLAEQYAAATGIQVHLQISDHALPQLEQFELNTRHTLYRAVQEGLTNIQKHAHATAAWVQLTLTDVTLTDETSPAVLLAIHDNGIGIDSTDHNSTDHNGEQEFRGFGLAGLAERANQSNGTLQLQSSPHGGSVLLLTLPTSQPPTIQPIDQAIREAT